MGVVNTTDRNLTDAELNQLKSYMMANKRQIKFCGNITSEILNMTDDIICLCSGIVNTFVSILASAITYEDLNVSFLHQWIKEKVKVMFLHLDKNNNVVSFAILHRVDYDPYRKHKNPYVLDYIYTYELYRNMGYAQSLIKKIKQDYEFTAFCLSDLSDLVFQKCQLKAMKAKIQGMRVMRT